MNTLRIDRVRNIIRLANKCYPPNNEVKITNLSDVPLDEILRSKPEEVALGDEISSLGRDEIIELAALMWLGRGAGGEIPNDWDNLISHAEEMYDDSTASYITEKVPLAEYLTNGLRKLTGSEK